MSTLSVEVAAHAGTCYGVERALRMATSAVRDAEHGDEVHTLGPLIHNPPVVSELEQEGVKLADTLDDVSDGAVVIRAHGVVPEIIDEAKHRKLDVVDATCPYVKKVHLAAEKFAREGYQVLVVGEPGHPEVEGSVGHAGQDAVVVSSPEDVRDITLQGKVGIVVQTTQTPQNLSHVVAVVGPLVDDLRVTDTICAATSERQEAAAQLAQRSDIMLVIGGKNSGNTRRLAQICAARCARTYHIEDVAEIDDTWFEPHDAVGVTAGASTPQTHIDRVLAYLAAMDI